MKLYGGNLSNFVTKSKIAMYEKGLAVELTPPPGGGAKSPGYLAINPFGKVPALDADGTIVAESEVINEYLEDKYPAKPLMPKSPEARARVRSFTRFHDLYLEPPIRALLGQMNPASRDPRIVEEKVTEITRTADVLEKMLSGGGGYAAGADFSLADCALAPTILFATMMLGAFGTKPILEGRPKLAAWWSHVQERPSVKRALSEQMAAIEKFQKTGTPS
jgi:glutathione S-transferase